MNLVYKYFKGIKALCLASVAIVLLLLLIPLFIETDVYLTNSLNIVVIGILILSFTLILFLEKKVTSVQNSSKKENLKLEILNAEIEDVTRSMVHDLKGPLRSIGSFAQLARRRLSIDADEDVIEYMEYITNGTSRMAQLLDSIMDYSKINSQDYMREKVIMDDLLDDVKMNLLDMINEKNVSISTFNLPEIIGNRFQMMQVLQNLLENAIKYNETACPKVIISAEETTKEYMISFKDNGIGINSDYQEKVFQIFQRLNPHLYEGTGIGLAICKKIIENHRGKIWLESEEGKGSTFYFTLPKPTTIKMANNRMQQIASAS